MKTEVDGTVKEWHWGEWIRDPNDSLNKWIRIKVIDKMDVWSISYV